MKANAPEKLYLSKNIYSTYLYQVPVPNDDTTVEYTRTDAFVEKACSYIRLHSALLDTENNDCMQEWLNKFRNAMEK